MTARTDSEGCRRNGPQAMWSLQDGEALSRLAPLRVFLVEDSALLRDRIVQAVSMPGRIEVVGHADTEKTAIDGINRCLPDAVIVDIQLREGSGLSVLSSVTQMIWIRLPVLIVLTNHALPEYAKACRALGADYFFDKSTEFEHVDSVLQSLADHRNRTNWSG